MEDKNFGLKISRHFDNPLEEITYRLEKESKRIHQHLKFWKIIIWILALIFLSILLINAYNYFFGNWSKKSFCEDNNMLYSSEYCIQLIDENNALKHEIKKIDGKYYFIEDGTGRI